MAYAYRCITLALALVVLSSSLAAGQGRNGETMEARDGTHPTNATMNGTAILGNLTAVACRAAGVDGVRCQESAAPRGDDDRPRKWGISNARGETEFDDRKSPRKVAFLGRSANVRIYPNASDPSVYLVLKFGKVVELDAEGRLVPGHSVSSLADASAAVTFSTGNQTINGNVTGSYVNMSLSPTDLQSFRPACGNRSLDSSAATASSGSRRLLQATMPSPPPPPQLDISLLFGLDGAISLPYGDNNVSVPANGLKFSILAKNWPFCDMNNTLRVSLHLMLANNASAEVQPADGNATTTIAQKLHIALGTSYDAYLSFLNYALDGPSGSLKMPVGVAILTPNTTAAAVNTTATAANSTTGAGRDGEHDDDGDNGGVTTVVMALPNPKKYNATTDTVYYDPTQTTTSGYLSATDPANGAGITITATYASADGAASALRMSALTVLAVTLLSIFLV